MAAWAASQIVRRLVEMMRHCDAALSGTDADAVHDMRVASRRLVATMEVFAPCYPQRKFDALRRQARQVTRALGSVRECDVLLEALEAELARFPDALALPRMIGGIRRERAILLREMRASIARMRSSGFPARLAEAMLAPGIEGRAR
jgi:CHAD domain-containing protein